MSRWNHETRVVDTARPLKVFVPASPMVESKGRRGFTIRRRGDVESLVTHAYRCPTHGLFDARVERASVPDEMPCRRGDGCSPDCECLVCSNPVNLCGLTSPWAGSFCGQGKAAGECAT